MSFKCPAGFSAVNKTTSLTSGEPPSIRQISLSPDGIQPPEMFKDALKIMVASWKTTHPKLKFPLELIAFFSLLPAKHNCWTNIISTLLLLCIYLCSVWLVGCLTDAQSKS
jgi:hypothetical protein